MVEGIWALRETGWDGLDWIGFWWLFVCALGDVEDELSMQCHARCTEYLS